MSMQIMIKPSAVIRQNYNEISTLCRKTGQPVFLTKKGKGDMVVMDIDTFNRRECCLAMREKLVGIEEMRMAGVRDIPAENVCISLRTIAAQKERLKS